MERRDFFKRLGFAGAALAVTPQILAEITPDPPSPGGEDLVIQTPDGTEIPCKSFSMDIRERAANGGIYQGDNCVFKIYDWNLDIVRPLIDISRDPRFSTKDNPVPPYKEYKQGAYSASVNGSGVIVEDFIPFDTSALLRLVLFEQDNVYDAEGYVTSLSYELAPDGPIENALTFHISGPITRTSRL